MRVMANGFESPKHQPEKAKPNPRQPERVALLQHRAYRRENDERKSVDKENVIRLSEEKICVQGHVGEGL